MTKTLRLALYQPDMAPNTGAIMRLCACFGVTLDIIGPCGFVLDDKKLRRSAMDYIDDVQYCTYRSFDDFSQILPSRRLVLFTTHGTIPYHHFHFQKDDILLFGRESAGVPPAIHEQAAERLIIPMNPKSRSLNVGMAAAIGLTEALRQVEELGT